MRLNLHISLQVILLLLFQLLISCKQQQQQQQWELPEQQQIQQLGLPPQSLQQRRVVVDFNLKQQSFNIYLHERLVSPRPIQLTSLSASEKGGRERQSKLLASIRHNQQSYLTELTRLHLYFMVDIMKSPPPPPATDTKFCINPRKLILASHNYYIIDIIFLHQKKLTNFIISGTLHLVTYVL